MIIFVYALEPDGTVFDDISKATEYSILWIPLAMLGLTLLTRNRKKTSYWTWYTLTWIQYIRWLCLINTSIDENLLNFYTRLIDGTTGYKIFPSKSTDLPSKFQEIGVENYYFINNTEKFFIAFCASISICIFLIVAGWKSNRFRELKEKFMGNFVIRTTLVCAYDFFIFAFLQFYKGSLSGSYDIINIIISAVIFIFCIIITIYSPIYISGQSSISLTPHNSTLLEKFKHTERFKGYYYFIYLFIRLGTSISLVFIQSSPVAQTIIIGLLELILILYIFLYKPFHDMNIGYYIASCEICTLAIIACLGSYASGADKDGKLFLRWVIFTSFCLGLLICIGNFVITLIKKLPENAQIKQVPEIIVVPANEGLNLDTRIKENSIVGLEAESNIGIKTPTVVSRQRDQPPLKSREENTRNDENKDRTRPELNTSTVPLFFDESNIRSELPYYSRLAAKYTRGIADNK
ncbi:hypothetical protein SteCoe_26500 [Stentor coeruleus]|uniref:TRP C-terminal domain-containing protein n=1 Tax=Stentor coeruleus TaxID=5963 RepID=A0A1R2BCQ0_9CILI|nr:hypothetical protein SteCoe_26500 [Stentor coeruleus]